MELRHLNTFKVVADVKGFTRAAEVLGYAQSSVTAQIQALEDELGVPLFNRLGKKIVLTQAGEQLLPYVAEVQKLINSAKADLTEGQNPQGTLTIGAPESLCAYRLPALLKEYRERYPQVKIILRPGVCWQLRQQVRSGALDMSFTLEEKVEMPDLHIESLLPEQIVLIAPPNHPLAGKQNVLPQDLKDETIFLTETGCPYRTQFEQQLNTHGIYLDTQLEFGSLDAIKQCVISRLGLAQVPAVAVQAELAEQKLVVLNWNEAPIEMETQIVYHKNKWISPAMSEFLALTKAHFQK
ncbi:MAG: LysR family transcriptional regulator [Tumebacillaceae bacterium]